MSLVRWPEHAQAVRNTRPDSGLPFAHCHFLLSVTAAAVLLLLTNGTGEKMEQRATETASLYRARPDDEEQKFWQLELDAAIDDCLGTCDLRDVISLTTTCACLKEGKEADLHSMAKKTSPRVHAALQNLASVLLARPHLARQGCAVLRGKLDALPNADYRKLLTGLLPPDDDPVFSEPFVVMAITREFLDDEERSELLSTETKERIKKRENYRTKR